jgi:hypothetical protein
MPRPARTPLARLVLASSLASALALGGVACGGDDDTTADAGTADASTSSGGLAASEEAAGLDRPSVTFSASPDGLTLPADIPAGLVDIRLEAAPGDTPHNIAVARLDEGVTYDQLTGLDPATLELITLVGGNTTVEPGGTADVTLDLAPGDHLAVDLGRTGELTAAAPFTVAEPGDPDAVDAVARPEAEGTITLGPGMKVSVPEGFDGTGTWQVTNEDPGLNHEAAMVRLAPGSTIDDLVAWTHDRSGPPPIAGELSGMGGLGPGETAWVTLDPGEPGEYALVCWIPGAEGVPHLGDGMFAAFTVR